MITALLITACKAQIKKNTMTENISTYHYKSHKTRLSEGNVFFTKEGKGNTTLVFLHGLSSNSDAWYRNIESLKDNYTCIALDLPGHGKSYKNAEEYTPTYYAKVLEEFLEKQNIKKIVLIGHSMGGQAAVRFANLHPEMVEKLILVAPAGIEEFSDSESVTIKTFTTKDAVKNTSDEQIERNYNLNFYKTPPEAANMIAERKAAKTASDFDMHALAIEKSVKGMLDDKVILDFPELKMPVLILFGKNDALIPNKFLHIGMTTEKVAEKGKNLISNSKVVMFEESGHFLQFEKPKEVNHAIAEFIQKQ